MGGDDRRNETRMAWRPVPEPGTACPCTAIAIHQDAPDPRIAISTSKRLDTPAAFATGHQLVPDRGHDVSVGVYCKILGQTRWHALRHAEPTGLAVRKPY